MDELIDTLTYIASLSGSIMLRAGNNSVEFRACDVAIREKISACLSSRVRGDRIICESSFAIPSIAREPQRTTQPTPSPPIIMHPRESQYSEESPAGTTSLLSLSLPSSPASPFIRTWDFANK